MPKTVAIANQKGGVGKTTTAVNICAAIAQRHPTLLVDLDAQANATASLGLVLGERPSVHEVLIRGCDPQEAILPTHLPGLSLLPASPSLVAAELELAPMIGREFKLRRAFQRIGETYEYIVIDCPPALSLLTLNAFAAADKVMVPVQCEYLALEGLSELLTTIELVQLNLNPQLALGGIMLTMYDHRTSLAKQVVEEVRKHFPLTFSAVIPRNVRVAEAPSHGLSVMEYAPASPGARAYKELAEEIVMALGG
ncbi:MAG: AAA family ATPase [Chloroflexi bacterium]|nr:AAA family ATPase [Chloroflexota bacterium]